MASTADRNDPVGEPPGGDGSEGRPESRLPAESPSPYGPELGPRPYVLLMTVIGGIGAMCVVIAVVLGVSTDPAYPMPENIPTQPGQTALPSGFPTALPTDLPTDYWTNLPTELPSDLPTNLPTDGIPSFPTDFPSLPSLPDFSLPPLGDDS